MQQLKENKLHVFVVGVFVGIALVGKDIVFRFIIEL
jgi:hypothetical protein